MLFLVYHRIKNVESSLTLDEKSLPSFFKEANEQGYM